MHMHHLPKVFVVGLIIGLCGARGGVAADLPGGDDSGVLCPYLITMADDFVVEAYQNGAPIPDDRRELLVECFGASGEKMNVSVRPGDWLVFHVVQNRLRWNGSKYFAVAGCIAPNRFAFVSDPGSVAWSACDDPAQADAFIHQRDAGRNGRARVIDHLWGDGDGIMRQQAGAAFDGKPLWGGAASTWIKFNVPPAPRVRAADLPVPRPREPRRWPVQILSAIYGTGGKDADVTARVKAFVETSRRPFSANPGDLGADPNPYWNKGLHIVYLKDGVRREQRRNENETILPESFYGPQDAAELRAWLPESRWSGKDGEIQFHADGTFTLPGDLNAHRWEATGGSRLQLTWPGDRAEGYHFDFTWSGFSQDDHDEKVFWLAK